MANLDMLIKQLEQQWDVSSAEACRRLIGAMGKAINTPLGTIKMASDLLKNNTESVPAQQWAGKCHQQSLHWRDNYQKIVKFCLDQPVASCPCVLQEIENLFVDSSDLLVQFKQLPVEEKLADLYRLILQQLTLLNQIHLQLQAKDLSWLLSHVAVRRDEH
jgi:hypothetical protein